MNRVKACPFCGDINTVLEEFGKQYPESPVYTVTCESCGAKGPSVYMPEDYCLAGQKAIDRWNNRIPDIS